MTNSEISKGRYARVYILDNPYVIDRPFDYFIPNSIEPCVGKTLCPGSFVTVPFGRGNRKQIALVTEILDAEELPKDMDADKIKPVDGLCSGESAEELMLSEEQLDLCFFIKDQTLCTMGEAVRAAVPSSALSRLVEYYSAAPAEPKGDLSHADLLVYEYILARTPVSEPSLKNRFGTSAAASVERLIQKKLVTKELNIQKAPSTPTEGYYSLSVSEDVARLIIQKDKSAPVRLTSALQIAALDAVLSKGELSAKQVNELCGATKTQLKALVTKGILKLEERVAWRDPYTAATQPDRTPFLLNEEQDAAFCKLSMLADGGKPAAALLHGVTGSGKTCVILSLIDRMMDSGKGAIVLLPEISLTPQIAAQFLKRYGQKVAVLHSGLSAGERHDAYMKIRAGLATVVVGTRSAVFAPVKDLGLIVIDEEQEHTYKSDMNPKYHAHDIARFRCAHNSALLLLSSATPSLNSYYKAMEGKYHLIKMKNRYGGATLPQVEIQDMRSSQASAVTPIGDVLAERLVQNFADKNQSVLFLNRRGYSTQLVCRSCGAAVTCPNCSVAMNYHTRKGSYDSGEMVCHWCGSRRRYPDACPNCSSAHLVRMGYGTQRVEEELSSLLPSAKILRMDADTTSAKFSYDEMLSTFRSHRADVLLGTQMVTKGHDFPDVTLVGVLMADMSLYLDDYRASERTFSMLTQVIGRAGRAEKPGTALIQTMNPDSDVIKLACRQDYELFYEREIKLRRLLVFPPFCDIVLLTLSSPDEKELSLASVRLAQELMTLSQGDFADVPLVSFGPFEAPVYRVENCYRMRMVVKCRLNKRSRALFSSLLLRFAPSHKGNAKPILSIDLNPSSL